MKKLLLLMVVGILALGASAKNENDTIVTFNISPMMHCVNCENKIKSNLRFEKGVKEIKASTPGDEVSVKFDKSKTSVDNVVKGFGKIGYTAVPASDHKETKGCCQKAEGCCQKSEGCCN